MQGEKVARKAKLPEDDEMFGSLAEVKAAAEEALASGGEVEGQ